jgi:pimeloyl-ACP methyl ester carboxylesterase
LGKNYHLILGAAHNANQDKPEEINKIIGNFLKE